MSVDVARIDELDAIPVADGFVWRPVRRRFDIRGFGVNAYTSEGVGRHIVEEHTEGSGHEELYVVLRGRATFTVGDDRVDAPAGTMVFVRDSTLRRGAIAETEDAAVLAVGGKPGEAFQISPWEYFFAAIPYTRQERWNEAIETIRAGLDVRPGHPALLYNLACVEARAGDRVDALLHLQDAVRADAKYGDYARRDTDFAAIRREPGFPA